METPSGTMHRNGPPWSRPGLVARVRLAGGFSPGARGTGILLLADDPG